MRTDLPIEPVSDMRHGPVHVFHVQTAHTATMHACASFNSQNEIVFT